MVTSVEHIKPNGKYSVIQAAQAMDVSRGTIYNWAKSGLILFSLGRTKRRLTISGAQLIKYFNTQY
ncbi:MAG: helix-turn-helix domain-containing protein [Bacteroidales bacterium]|nr:helix-turn-helix domain-containing protein [Bacteroidales bacterium]